jgi:predicted RNA-binding Zn ribbon-like protein
MGFLDKAKAAAEQAANRANETVADVQTKRELTKAYGELGETAYRLADSGAVSHPELQAHVTRIRELQAKLDEDEAGAANGDAPADATEAVEQPLSGAGPGAA